jgi:spore coat polysaccharide biosynthesis predicted glycosyltransferase SpsG
MSRIVFCCDAGRIWGIGHVMRCVALAEELASRGMDCVFVADLAAVPWAAAQVRSRGFGVRQHHDGAPGLTELVLSLEPTAVVLDSYHAEPALSRGVRSAGAPVLAIIDGDARGQIGDLYVDQNLDADRRPAPADAPRLGGLDYALLRNDVLALRPIAPPNGSRQTPPRVVAYFGGTDAAGASPPVMAALAGSGEPFHATVVAPGAELRSALADVPLAAGQVLSVIEPTDRLMRLAAGADVVISAAGTSLWELLCVGAAAAVVCVVDNQEHGYGRAVASGAVAGLGSLDDVRTDPAAAANILGELLRDVARRDRMRAIGWSMVDGLGRARVATALTELISDARLPR